ncbi:Aste57867_2674 [Aphanomyces stellatus]|uniref:Aste57867_2674 protein n=1 Tax=Aphanomyces stellatus TaxID=120398 RepID=A0A485KCC4_9STRA|nr:hypothetical protein As57867_002667 [Aphanomyces stellatus]VFT79868.1 Aste57867_2674 [Aphanomyces stellatus]
MQLASLLVLAISACVAHCAATTTTAPSTAPTCKLQFTSPCDTSIDCGNLNGFNLTCIKSGGNKQCGCTGNKCQAQSNASDVAYQFDQCTSQRPCIAGNGFTALDAAQLSAPTCGEPLYCVQEKNPDPAAVLQSICHTCGSCKTQNVQSAKDPSVKRFDCTKLCPTPAPTPAPTTDEPTTAPSTNAITATTTQATKNTPAPTSTTATSKETSSTCVAAIGSAAVMALAAMTMHLV